MSTVAKNVETVKEYFESEVRDTLDSLLENYNKLDKDSVKGRLKDLIKLEEALSVLINL